MSIFESMIISRKYDLEEPLIEHIEKIAKTFEKQVYQLAIESKIPIMNIDILAANCFWGAIDSHSFYFVYILKTGDTELHFRNLLNLDIAGLENLINHIKLKMGKLIFAFELPIGLVLQKNLIIEKLIEREAKNYILQLTKRIKEEEEKKAEDQKFQSVKATKLHEERKAIMLSEVPIGIQESLEKFKKDFPDPNKVAFIILPFRETKAHNKIDDAIKNALKTKGIAGIRADDFSYHDDLWPNVLTYLYGCGFAFAVFERIENDSFNPNVSLEVGYLLALRKNVCLLKDKTLSTLHTDLGGKIYNKFDPQDPDGTIPEVIYKWLREKGLYVSNDATPISVEKNIKTESEIKKLETFRIDFNYEGDPISVGWYNYSKEKEGEFYTIYDEEIGRRVLEINSPHGTKFGIGYPQDENKIKIFGKHNFKFKIKTKESFFFYVRVADNKGKEKYLEYTTSHKNSEPVIREKGLEGVFRIDQKCIDNHWHTITFNLEEDLNRVFGMKLDSILWVRIRGNIRLEYFEFY
ncbi:MAG: CFAP20 family protein [Candidatus Eremiobacteraeota bacterium]|nr:CFAP20 family protein [Candidatus Eremiobacteraeota bacterium]